MLPPLGSEPKYLHGTPHTLKELQTIRTFATNIKDF